jgi:hypothetical protein
MAGKRPKGSPERIGRLLAGKGVSTTLGPRLKDLVIWQIWDQAVGEAIAGRTRPLRLVGGVLTVTVASGPWMQQLSFMKDELCQRINGCLGESRVKEIVLKAGSLKREQEPEQEPRRQPKPLSAQQQASITQQTVSVEDEGLRLSLQSLMESYYRNNEPC